LEKYLLRLQPVSATTPETIFLWLAGKYIRHFSEGGEFRWL